MAIVINFAGASIVRPGAYSRTVIAPGAAQQAQLGVMAIIGEADSGPQFQTGSTGLAKSTFSPQQFSAIASQYVSGELVDEAYLALNASADSQISGGAQQLIVLKTNLSTTAFGLLGPTATASYTGTIAGTSTPVTLTASMPGSAGNSIALSFTGSNTITAAISAWNLANPFNQVGLTSGSGSQTPTSGATAPLTGGSEYGVASADVAGLAGNQVAQTVTVTGGQATITLANSQTGVTEVSPPLGGSVDMTLLCTDGAASAATVTISGPAPLNATTLTTSITGGTTSNLNISLAQFQTIGQLADYINTIPGYAATTPNMSNANLPPSVMDQVVAQSIKTTPYSIVQDAYDVSQFYAKSSTLASLKLTASAGLPAASAKAYFVGGTRGATTAASVQAAIDALQAAQVNFIVPCFSQDATADIAMGVTDPASTYTIAAAIAGLRAHVAAMSSVTGKKERQGFVGFRGTFAQQVAAAATFSYDRISMHIQEPNVLIRSTASTGFKQPHAFAVLAAGMKCAAVVGLPNEFKQPNILGYRSPFGDFDDQSMGDEAINANLMFVEQAPGGGFRFVIDNSTYALQKDAWFHARPSVIYAADTAARTIRLNAEAFVGQRNSDVSPETVKNALVKVMDSLKASGITVGDAASGGKGYTVLNVTQQGSIFFIDVTLVLVEAIEFILNTITVQRASS